MAADKQITDFTHEVIHKLKDGNDEKTELIDFVTDYKNKIDPVLKGEKEVKKSHPFFKYKNRYKKAYQELYEYWLNKLNDLADRE